MALEPATNEVNNSTVIKKPSSPVDWDSRPVMALDLAHLAVVIPGLRL